VIFADLGVVLDPVPRSSSFNMAMDEVLMQQCEEPTLRFYRWARPSVSFGFFGAFEEVERCWPGRDPVRRWTGGGIVPHGEGEDVTYTLLVPKADAFARQPALESYRRIHEIIAQALTETFAAVELAPIAAPRISDACFENPAVFDILAAGKKIAGAAQRRNRHGLLHQGSIRFELPPGGLIARIADLLGKPQPPREATAKEMLAAEALAAEKYGTSAWMRRR
jgi:lipoyl(octanoyl) transferase